ncbi:ABC transporter permease [Intestinimonas butyriciproducens]|uniref:ABC transporter permease n=1 Tax=Intestinimonas butyriciproducens TaxID=1297617 RepID=UPI001959EA84|nr:ABC transporter permease [Intestinimonas butyriciproducens]
MNFSQAFKMAAKSISANKGRSALTMLGVIIGLAAVIILVSYAQGQNMALRAYYESMGTNTISVSAYSYRGNVDVASALYDYCLQLDDLVLGVSPTGYIYSDPVIKFESKTISRQWQNMGGGAMMSAGEYPQIVLGNDKYGLCSDYKISKGRDLSYLDIEKENQVCVLGSAVADELFGFADPVGKTITLNGTPFLVIGVYESKSAGVNVGNSEESQWIQETINRQDYILVLPSTMTRLFNNNQPIENYIIKAKDAESLKEVSTLVNGFLAGFISNDNGYYYIDNPTSYQNEQAEADKLQQRFLGGIAAISLLVGGIGIMNIMLVTVTERTREIGIRKAIGAERKSIIVQFLIEAAMICGIGGIFGILVGYLGTLIVGKMNFDIILIPSAGITVGAFLISVALGIIFGLYPAVKASGLQPVEALRAD